MYDCVFVRINKTGSTSVQTLLGQDFPHQPVSAWIAEIGFERWLNVPTFSIVRNPFDKVVSHYFWRIKTNQTGMGRDPISFRDWVRRSYGDNDPAYYDKPLMFAPQTEWLTAPEFYGDDRLGVDYVGRFEAFDEAVDHILDLAGKEKVSSLPWLKKTDRAPFSIYYDQELVEIVTAWFANDFDKLGYPRTLPSGADQGR